MTEKKQRSKKTWYALRTGLETGFNMMKGPLAVMAVSALGLNVIDLPLNLLTEIQNNYLHGADSFLAGFGVGIVKNAISIGLVLKNLEGKTKGGDTCLFNN
ncbi:MAG: hypothetical protein WC744_01655 [Patescibacteria group bacterium]|jgi:hypothetical protein